MWKAASCRAYIVFDPDTTAQEIALRWRLLPALRGQLPGLAALDEAARCLSPSWQAHLPRLLQIPSFRALGLLGGRAEVPEVPSAQGM